MKMRRAPLLIAAAALAAAPALAEPKGHGPKGKGNGHAAAFCPPGLAKKGNGCRPPGLAKKDRHHDDYRDAYRDDRRDGRYRYRVGDRIVDYDDLILIRDPGRYGLDPRWTYYRANDQVIRVDRETDQVLSLIGLVSAILGG